MATKRTAKTSGTQTFWKFLRLRDGALTSEHGGTRWEIGEWQEVAGTPSTCEHGFHCSRLALDALSYVKGEIVAQVEVAGAHADDGDKSAWQRMRVMRAWHWTKDDSVRLAIHAAEGVLHIYENRYPGDDRPRKAIEAARAYLNDHSYAAYAAYAGAYAYAADAAAYAYAAYAAAAAYAADAAAYAAAADPSKTRDEARQEMRARLSAWMEQHIVTECQSYEPVAVVATETESE